MSYKYFSKYLENNEEILGIVYSIKFFLYVKFFICFIIFLLPFFFMVPIMSLGVKGIFLFLLIILISFFAGLIVYIRWAYNCIIITEEKLYRCYQDWIFDREVKEFFIKNIEKIYIEYGNIFYRLFKIGDLVIVLSNGVELDINNIKNPKSIKNRILELKN